MYCLKIANKTLKEQGRRSSRKINNMFKKIDKVLAALGNMKAMERLHVDTFTEDKIKNIKGICF